MRRRQWQQETGDLEVRYSGGRMRFVIGAPSPFEDLLEKELHRELRLEPVERRGSSLVFEGTLEHALRAIMYSRVATRVTVELVQGPVSDPDTIYDLVRSIEWTDHLVPAQTLSVSYSGLGAGIRNTQFGGQRVKDAIVDQFRSRALGRPNVDPKRPDLAIIARYHDGQLSVGFDLGGGGLHRRGYRPKWAVAPLKENLAAALLLRAGWPKEGESLLVDPMCGSGTLLIEGAMIAYDIAPGLMRPATGFGRWVGHDRELWNRLRDEAKARRNRAMEKERFRFEGADVDGRALSAAHESVMRSSLGERLVVRECDARSFRVDHEGAGVLVANLPYGERLGEVGPQLRDLYRSCALAWREHFAGLRFALLVAQDEVARHLPVNVERRNAARNGRIECWWLQGSLQIPDRAHAQKREESRQQISNRLKKNAKRLRSWVRRENVAAYRVYDSDMPEFAVAIDRYGDWVHVQEYAAPATVDRVRAQERLDDVLAAVPEALGVSAERVVLKVRERQRGKSQYERKDTRREHIEVTEGAARLLVNLHDYLDTGLFLDHRPMRLRLAELCNGKNLLNLFCYTAAATVHAAKGGARSTTSVDLSNTYLRWAEDNLRVNGLELGQRNALVRADVLEFLRNDHDTYDVIFCDPPAFSNSKSMVDSFDVQRDHVRLIEAAMAHLAEDGVLIFSTNLRRFALDAALATRFRVDDVTPESIPPDFERNRRIHVCFEIRRR